MRKPRRIAWSPNRVGLLMESTLNQLRTGTPRMPTGAEPERGLDRGTVHRPSSALADQRIRQSLQPLGGLPEAITAKPKVEAKGGRGPLGQGFKALGFFPEVTTRIAQGIERLDVVAAGEAGDGVAQGKRDHEGSLHFSTAELELQDWRQQEFTDPQAGQHRCQGRCAGKIGSWMNASWHCHPPGCETDRSQR